MKVECRIVQNADEPHACIFARRMTPTLAEAIALLENEDAAAKVLPGHLDGKIFFLHADDLEIVRSEGREIVCYDTQGRRFVLSRPLYEVEEMLGNTLVRISKSALVRLDAIDHVEASFHGTMRIVMRNGTEDSISRSFRRAFRERLGI